MKSLWSVLCGASALVFLTTCGDSLTSNDNLDGFLRITKITGAAGGGGTGSGTTDVLHSDVLTGTGDTATMINDNATVTVQLFAKNPLLTAPSRYSDVRLEQYEVRYFRTDGLNTEGVNVPYRITGPLATSVVLNGTADVTIVIVRQQAKAEPPLRNLRGGGGQSIITCVAEITIYGRTLAGQVTTASGQLQVTFADFGG